jgi:hypothetical protein
MQDSPVFLHKYTHTHMHMHTHGHGQAAWSWTCIIGMVMDKDHECQNADEMFSPASLVFC